MTTRKVLLLGGTGFIGSRVLDALRRRPDVRLMTLGHRRVDYRALEDVNLVVGSLERFDLSWLEIFGPDTVIHLARIGASGRVRREIAARRGRRANQRLVEWLRGHAPRTRVVYVSGTLVYGDRGEETIDERASVRPTSFARQYVLAETPWMEAQAEKSLAVTIVRPPWVVGPGSWLQAHYVRPALRGGGVPLYGSGENWMTFLDVDDCAGTIVHVALAPERLDTINLLAPGQMARQREFVETLAGMLRTGVHRVGATDRGLVRDAATREALTTSLRASTLHAEALHDYPWRASRWPEMLARHVAAA